MSAEISTRESPQQKVVLVSGASGVIGEQVCRLLLESGAAVIALYNSNPSPLAGLADRFPALETRKVNLLDSAHTAEALRDILKGWPRIDALIACAGKTLRKPAMLVSEEEETDLLRLNFLASVQLAKAVLRPMFRQGGGSVVFVGSRAGAQGLAGQAVYAGAKGALESYAKSLAQEVGGKGIRVNVVAPGAVKDLKSGTYSEEESDWVAGRIALNRLADPEEIAAVTVFLTSEAARYVTGATIAVDGGGRF